MKKFRVFFFCLLSAFFFTACEKSPPPQENLYPLYRIVVLSDIHYMDPSLLVNDGTAFQTYLFKDPKLLAASDSILQATITQIINASPDLVLISGDLTKDGERISHTSLIALLKQFTDHYIKVVVTIGNHDVSNPEAKSFDGDQSYPVESISPEEVPVLYADFGFGSAVSTDPNSLSYICEPLPGLQILAIDANEYYLNGDTVCVTSGKIKPETMDWAVSAIAQAQNSGKVVFGMMHHGIIQHYTGQQQIDPGYLVDDWQHQADKFIQAGLRIMLTGHYHATDMVMTGSGSNFLIDVETGSLVTAPCAYRTIVLYDDMSTIRVTTNNVTGVTLPDSVNFDTYKTAFLKLHLDALFSYMLLNPPYQLDSATAAFGSRRLRNGLMAHYAGNENLAKPESDSVRIFSDSVPSIGAIVQAWWNDLNLQDKSLRINLKTGLVK